MVRTKQLAVLAIAAVLMLSACSSGVTVTPSAGATPAASGAATPAATTPAASAAATPAASAAATPAPTTAPTTAPSPTAAAAEKVANFLLYFKGKNWNPLALTNGPDVQRMILVYDVLVIVSNRAEYEGRLAESWTVSPDAKTYTFKLRPGLKWSDGEAFTSSDVLFTYKLLVNPKVSQQAGRFTGVVGADTLTAEGLEVPAGLRAPDANTFEIELKEPDAGFLFKLAWPFSGILPEHLLSGVTAADLTEETLNPFFLGPTTGMGPFTFVEEVQDQYTELVKNPNHWRPVAMDRVFLKELTSDVAAAQLRTGELDLAQTTADEASTLDALDNVVVESEPGLGPIRMAWSNKQEYLKDKRIRQAILHAIDRQAIVDEVLQGRGSVINNYILGPDWALPSGLNAYPYDPERAKQLLTEAGWDFNRTVKVQWLPGRRDRDTTLNIVQGQLAAIGFKLELNPLEAGPYVENLESRDFEFTLYGGGNYAFEPDAISQYLLCDQPFPTGAAFFCDETGEVDRLILEGRSVADQAQRATVYQELSRLLNDVIPEVWLYLPDTVWGRSERLQGFKPHGDFLSMFWNAAEWSV